MRYQCQENYERELLLLRGGVCFKNLMVFTQLYNSIVPLPPGLHVVPQKPIE